MLKTVFRAAAIGLAALYFAVGHADGGSVYARRRQELCKRIQGSVAVLEGAPETRSYAQFRQDNNFYYLTGVETPGALLLLDGTQNSVILFLPRRDRDLERWEGPRLYPGQEARASTGFDEVLETDSFAREIEKRRAAKAVYVPLAPLETAATSRDRALRYQSARESDPWDGRVSRETAFQKNLESKTGLSIRNLSPILDDMRRVKDPAEIELLRQSGHIGALGIREAIRSARPGMYEYQIAALAGFVFSWHGAMGPAFFPIVGSGPNSCLLHYSANTRKTVDGDIVVLDFGADYRYYQSDITRTFPISGRFSPEQAKVYRIVLEAQKAALEKVRPGGTFGELNETVREALDRYGYARYLDHGVTHYVGMATHDVGTPAPFVPGVVVTVEPGVYMPEKDLGIRIEDTVLVTGTGCEILTGDVPKEIGEIETLMTERGIASALMD